MNNCLNEADSKRYNSIAFPAIGTGNLGFPRDVVAKEMFTVIYNFARANPKTSIKDVRFIVYQKDTGTISVSIGCFPVYIVCIIKTIIMFI